jgi:hypothetical protein
MRRRGAARLAAAAALLLCVCGCETTQELSAKIGRQLGHQSAITGTAKLGTLNAAVRVGRKVLLSSGGQTAVALQLVNASATTQVAFPVLIDVTNAAGRPVYSNGTEGIDISLQQLALLAPHSSAWWVDNEVLATAPKSVSVKLGASTAAAPAAAPEITTTGASASASFPGPHVAVTVTNRSAVAQRELAVYAVLQSGERVVGAGRGVVPALAARASAQLLIPIVGSIDGRTISLTAAPTDLH